MRRIIALAIMVAALPLVARSEPIQWVGRRIPIEEHVAVINSLGLYCDVNRGYVCSKIEVLCTKDVKIDEADSLNGILDSKVVGISLFYNANGVYRTQKMAVFLQKRREGWADGSEESDYSDCSSHGGSPKF